MLCKFVAELSGCPNVRRGDSCSFSHTLLDTAVFERIASKPSIKDGEYITASLEYRKKDGRVVWTARRGVGQHSLSGVAYTSATPHEALGRHFNQGRASEGVHPGVPYR